MGGKSSGEVDPKVESGLLANQNALSQIASGQTANASQLYNLTEPGLATAETFYQTLAAGDPNAIMKAVAPTAQAASETAAGAKANIMANAPAGGEKNLALEQADLQRAGTIAKTISGATTGSFNALAQLASQGIGESQAATAQATGAYSAGTTALSDLGNMKIEEQKIQAEEKGSMLGGIGQLAGTGMEVGASLAAGFAI